MMTLGFHVRSAGNFVLQGTVLLSFCWGTLFHLYSGVNLYHKGA